MTTLYCPKCDYNLTGLSRNICPECGTAFDPAELERSSQIRRPAFNRGVLYVLTPPVLFGIASWFAFQYPNMDSPEALIYGGVGILLAAAATSIIAGRRLARRLARRRPSDPPTPVTIGMTILFAAIFLCFQCALAFALFFVACAANLKI